MVFFTKVRRSGDELPSELWEMRHTSSISMVGMLNGESLVVVNYASLELS